MHFSGFREAAYESDMDDKQTCYKAWLNEGIRCGPSEVLGSGDRHVGHAKANPAPKSYTMSLDEQLEPVLRDDDPYIWGNSDK